MKIIFSTLISALIIVACHDSKKKEVRIKYYPNGEIRSVERFQDGILNGQSLWFDSFGRLKETGLLRAGKMDGPGYKFYPSGMLDQYRYFRDDKQADIGFDYYDHPLFVVKAMSWFDDSNRIYYQRNFDDHGHLTSEKGTRPDN